MAMVNSMWGRLRSWSRKRSTPKVERKFQMQPSKMCLKWLTLTKAELWRKMRWKLSLSRWLAKTNKLTTRKAKILSFRARKWLTERQESSAASTMDCYGRLPRTSDSLQKCPSQETWSMKKTMIWRTFSITRKKYTKIIRELLANKSGKRSNKTSSVSSRKSLAYSPPWWS